LEEFERNKLDAEVEIIYSSYHYLDAKCYWKKGS
jgi:hypothetical protein